MYPDLQKPKSYEMFLLSQCAMCSLRFFEGSPKAIKLRVLRNENNCADFEEMTNFQVLCNIYGVTMAKLTSNLITSLENVIPQEPYIQMTTDLLYNDVTDLPDSFCLALCPTCAPKLANLYGSFKSFTNALATDSFILKAIVDTRIDFNNQFRSDTDNTPTECKLEQETTYCEFPDDFETFHHSPQPSPPEDDHYPQNLEDSPKPKDNVKNAASSQKNIKSVTSAKNTVSFPSRMFCNDCGTQFTSDYAITVHKLEFHEGKQLEISREKLTGPPYTCPVSSCGRKYSKHQGVKYHCLRKHNFKLLTFNDNEQFSFCSICQLRFPTRRGFRRHWSLVHREQELGEMTQFENKEPEFKCYRCPNIFKSIKEIQKHGLAVHLPQLILDQVNPPIVTNSNCDDIESSNSINTTSSVFIRSRILSSATVTEFPNMKTRKAKMQKIKKSKKIKIPKIKKEKKPKKSPSELEANRKTYKKHVLYNMHTKIDQPRRFYCQECTLTWQTVQELLTHNDSCHDSREKYFCVDCDSQFNNINLLGEHSWATHQKKMLVDKEVNFWCSECDKAFKDAPEFEIHTAEIHKKYQCAHCLYIFSSSDARFQHAKRHLPDFPKTRCEFCEKDYSTIFTLQTHQEHSHHEELMLPEIREPCPFCEKSYKWKNHLKIHIDNEHAREKPYKCNQCDKAFSDKGLLGRHVRNKHEKEKEFKCPHCVMSFYYVRPYNLHVAGHLDERPYACEKCGKTFKRDYELKVHMIIHDGIPKKIFCEKCGSGFKRMGHFRKHMANHADLEKDGTEFICKVCGLKLKHTAALKIHMRWKHSTEHKAKYFCKTCNKKFRNEKRLSAHMKSKHQDEKSPAENDTVQKSGPKSSQGEDLNCESLKSSSSNEQLNLHDRNTNPPLNFGATSSQSLPLPLPMPLNENVGYPYLNYNMAVDYSSGYHPPY